VYSSVIATHWDVRLSRLSGSRSLCHALVLTKRRKLGSRSLQSLVASVRTALSMFKDHLIESRRGSPRGWPLKGSVVKKIASFHKVACSYRRSVVLQSANAHFRFTVRTCETTCQAVLLFTTGHLPLDSFHWTSLLCRDSWSSGSSGFFKEILELHKRRGLGDGSPPAGSRGGAPVGGLGDEVPRSCKHIVVYCNKF